MKFKKKKKNKETTTGIQTTWKDTPLEVKYQPWGHNSKYNYQI